MSNSYRYNLYILIYDLKLIFVFCNKIKFFFSEIANDSNSIIGMWALQPSIFELLSTKLDPTIIKVNDPLRFSLMFLLYSHCKK